MKTDRIEIHYQLEFERAFHCGTGLRVGLLHRSIARDADGFLYVPGSTIKGILRDHATQIATFLVPTMKVPSQHTLKSGLAHMTSQPNIVTHLFGSHYQPGTLFFDDATLCKEQQEFYEPFLEQQIEARTQVSMSRVTRTARSGMLFSSEYGTQGMTFDGVIYGMVKGVPIFNDTEDNYSLILLLAALSSLDRIGGGKSAGFGVVTCKLTYLQVNDKKFTGETAEKQVAAYLDLLELFGEYETALELAEEGAS
jgi:CRISPR/Cas system CSM-associated protein Csm3 (group 7 of RAMP superfamily)